MTPEIKALIKEIRKKERGLDAHREKMAFKMAGIQNVLGLLNEQLGEVEIDMGRLAKRKAAIENKIKKATQEYNMALSKHKTLAAETKELIRANEEAMDAIVSTRSLAQA